MTCVGRRIGVTSSWPMGNGMPWQGRLRSRRPGVPVTDAESLQVRVEILTVGGEEGAALRAAQARVIHDLLRWADDENSDTNDT